MIDEQEHPFNQSIYNLIEFLTQTELRNTSKRLVDSYMDDRRCRTYTDKARFAVQRYTQEEIPTLDELKEKNNTGAQLSTFDHMVLKMLYQARLLDNPKKGRR
ncbi:MAG: hypothetical protein ACLFR1_12050 [Spirochaetia bacterium]